MADLFPSLEFLHVITGAKGRITKIHKMVDTVIGNIIKEHRDSLICTDESRKEDSSNNNGMGDVRNDKKPESDGKSAD